MSRDCAHRIDDSPGHVSELVNQSCSPRIVEQVLLVPEYCHLQQMSTFSVQILQSQTPFFLTV